MVSKASKLRPVGGESMAGFSKEGRIPLVEDGDNYGLRMRACKIGEGQLAAELLGCEFNFRMSAKAVNN